MNAKQDIAMMSKHNKQYISRSGTSRILHRLCTQVTSMKMNNRYMQLNNTHINNAIHTNYRHSNNMIQIIECKIN